MQVTLLSIFKTHKKTTPQVHKSLHVVRRTKKNKYETFDGSNAVVAITKKKNIKCHLFSTRPTPQLLHILKKNYVK